MKTIQGKAVYKGIALGPIHVMKNKDFQVTREKIADVEVELARVQAAKKEACVELQVLYEKALKEVGESNASIFQVHQMLLEDDDYQDSIANIIRTQQVNAEYAAAITGDNFSEMFAAMDDEYMQARAADIKDITERVIKRLCGIEDNAAEFTEPVIIVANNLAPSETVVLDKSKILAFVTVCGSTTSHTAILARTMNIPALIGVDMDITKLKNGTVALVDAFKSEFTLEPSEEMKQKAYEGIIKAEEQRAHLKTLKGKENVTLSGKKIDIYANIGSLSDLGYALENDAGGVGLFRSEFLYIGRNSLPGEEEQYNTYKTAAQNLAGKKLIVRTLDIGADKQVDYLQLGEEENPALGCRAIRICLTRTEIFKTQLRALYRAAVHGNIAIMYPMIISTDEVKAVKKITEEVKAELREEGIPYKEVEEGIMIETPAAAMISDELAKMVDFFSVGTNDLTQYTLAIDRQNTNLEAFYNPYHPAVLRLIKIAADNIHKEGKWIGICGELGADPEMTRIFLEMGIDELSVVPSSVLKLRKVVREMP